MKRALSRSQAAELLRAASTLPPASREAFFAAVDSRLIGIRHPLNDGDVNAAIIAVLGDASITTTSHCLMCDAAPKEADMAKNYDDDDDDAFGPDGLLRDGKRTRVSLMMRDGVSDTQRAIAQDASARLYNDRRPGPVYSGDRSAAAAAYRKMCIDAENAWKMLPEAPTDTAPLPQRDAAPVQRFRTIDEARQIRKAAYDAMIAESRDAWRNPLP